MVDDGDAAAEASVGLREFEANVPAAKDEQMIWEPVEFEHLDIRERLSLSQAGHRRNAGVRASILVRTGYGAEVERKHASQLDRAMVVDDLGAAADWILNQK